MAPHTSCSIRRLSWNGPVAENPAEPDGRKIELFVAVLPALSKVAEPDAFTVIAGGPGQASTEFYVSVAGSFERIRRERDIVLVDQRADFQQGIRVFHLAGLLLKTDQIQQEGEFESQLSVALVAP